MLIGIVKSVNPVSPLNAPLDIVVIVSGITTFVILVYPLKALLPILVTFTPLYVEGITISVIDPELYF